jgi:hypothetical protein
MSSYVVGFGLGISLPIRTYSYIFLHVLTDPYLLLARYSIQDGSLGIHSLIVQTGFGCWALVIPESAPESVSGSFLTSMSRYKYSPLFSDSRPILHDTYIVFSL